MNACKLLLMYVVVLLSSTIAPSRANETAVYPAIETQTISYHSLKKKAKEALAYCTQKRFNTTYCILIDMSMHSGLNRFIVWDFTRDTILMAIPVSHGCGDNNWRSDDSKTNPCISNVDGSHCSSVGKYKIGKRGNSNWGIGVNYLMHGLETSNSNALARQIVFHSWEAVPDDETYPNGCPEGWGCPAISNNNMRIIDSLLKKQTTPVLMWVYN
jgi:hypothetical protein